MIFSVWSTISPEPFDQFQSIFCNSIFFSDEKESLKIQKVKKKFKLLKVDPEIANLATLQNFDVIEKIDARFGTSDLNFLKFGLFQAKYIFFIDQGVDHFGVESDTVFSSDRLPICATTVWTTDFKVRFLTYIFTTLNPLFIYITVHLGRTFTQTYLFARLTLT